MATINNSGIRHQHPTLEVERKGEQKARKARGQALVLSEPGLRAEPERSVWNSRETL